MYVWHRWGLSPLLVIALLAVAWDAAAWVETNLRSDFVQVDLERDGSAVVSHEMTMRVRGGPLEGFVLEGVDGDAQPLPDATVVEVHEGRSSTPISLLLDLRDDGALAIEVDRDKGIRRGTFLWRFSYRTQLLDRGLIEPEGERAQIRWVGPRYADGIDSVKVVLRVPSSAIPPRLPHFDPAQAELGLEEDPGGVFLSTLRRAAEKDELEIVRPHVAKGEPVVWRAVVDARAFSELTPPPPPVLPQQTGLVPDLNPRERNLVVGGAIGAALLYALLVWLKWQALAAACVRRRATPRALIPLPAVLRGVLAGALLLGALGVALLLEQPTVAGVLLIASMALAAHVTPRATAPLRGPGNWKAVSDEEAFHRRVHRLPGAWLDAGVLSGFALFSVLLLGFAAAALLVLPQSPYHALLIVIAAGSLVPLFCTGRTSALPADPASRPQGFLKRVAKRLRRGKDRKVVPLLRFPIGGEEADELRLLVMPRPAVPGLVAIEVGVEYQLGAGGPVAFPVVLVRALEDSPAHERLGGAAPWSRGRRAEERVAVLRPKLPTLNLTVSLAQRLATMLTDTRRRVRRSHQPSIKTPIPGGKGVSERASNPRQEREPPISDTRRNFASKRTTPSAPAHPTS